MNTYFVVCDYDMILTREYLNRRPELKSLVELSRNGVWHDYYPNFVLWGFRLQNEMYEEMLDEYLDALDMGLHLKYGAEYDEFVTFCNANYKYSGTEYLERRIVWKHEN